MNAIRKLTLVSAAIIALGASGSASAADYLFDFQFDALVSDRGNFAATNIVYAGDDVYATTLTYVSGDVNGGTAPELVAVAQGNPTGQRAYVFSPWDLDVPVGSIADIFFSLTAPIAAGQTHETIDAGRGIRSSSGISYRYTTGRLTITERVAAVPEPATWATLIVGFLFTGAAMRRRGPIRSVRIAYT